MYVNDVRTLHDAAVGSSIVLRPSDRFYYQNPAQVGEVVAPAPAPGATPAPPRGLTLLEHFHAPRRPAAGVPGAFVTDPVARLTVGAMNPGFIDASDQLITDTSPTGLQTCLQKLITTKFQSALSSRSSTTPSSGDRVRVALVDLTGSKITKPDFAGWGSTVAMYGASVPKILGVYGAYQLRADLRRLAATRSMTSGPALEKLAIQNWKLKAYLPNLPWLFDIRRWAGGALDFTPAAKKALDDIMHNEAASSVISSVGFPFIGSLTWQSGLYHPTRGGLWLSGSYGKGSWGSNPVPAPTSANVTALSVATYFTLLAQRRLVDEAASADMERVLRGGCVTGWYPLTAVASKCGVYGDYLHDAALVSTRGVRYVVVGLTRTNMRNATQTALYTQLFTELENLIVQNNRAPKAAC